MAITNLTTIANDAAADIGVLDSGETLSAQQLADSLDIGNKILDNWSSDQIMAPVATFSQQSLLAGNGQYSVGPALTWNLAPAPVRITSATLIMSNSVSLPIKVVTSAEWDQIKDRLSTSDLIEYLFYSPGAVPPNGTGTAFVSAIPRSNGAAINFQYWRPFTQFADTTTSITLPAGYALAFEYALARALSRKLDVPWSPENAADLAEYMNRLRQLNIELWGQIAAGAPALPQAA